MSSKSLLEPHPLVFPFDKYPPGSIALLDFVRGLSENWEIHIESVKSIVAEVCSCPLHLFGNRGIVS